MSRISPLDMQYDGRTCPVWIDSRDARCGRDDLIDGRWCKLHTPVMRKRIKGQWEARAKGIRLAPELAAKARARVAEIDAEIARRTDVQPCTGWKRSKLNDANVVAVAALNRERDWLVTQLGGEPSRPAHGAATSPTPTPARSAWARAGYPPPTPQERV